MENKKKLSTGATVGIVVLAVLSVAEIIINYVFTIWIWNYPIPSTLFELVPYTFLFIAIVYYAFVGYKKPHGDLLRVVFLAFSFYCLGTIVSQAAFAESKGLIPYIIMVGGSALITAYVGGRLDKIKKNYGLLIIVSLVLLVKGIFHLLAYSTSGILFLFWNCSPFVLWLDIAFAYILRYKEHKEAGLADKN